MLAEDIKPNRLIRLIIEKRLKSSTITELFNLLKKEEEGEG
jgi:hypothetical protein